MKLYRVDKRLYNIGEEILPNTDYSQALNNESKEKLEKNLMRGDIPKVRKKCLFLFNSLYHALIFFSKYGDHIYEVVPNDILSRGDINKLNNILDALRF